MSPEIITIGIMDMLFPFGGINSFIYPGDSVFLKPHCRVNAQPYQAENIDPAFLNGVVNLCFEAGASKVFIGEYPLEDGAFRSSGIEDVAMRNGAELLDLSKTTPVKRRLDDALIMENAEYYNEPLLTDVFINLPKLKTDEEGLLECAFANLAALLGPNLPEKYHHHKDRLMVDTLNVFRPDLTLVDGFLAYRQGEPVPGHVFFAGIDTLAVDVIAATLMGVELNDMPGHRLAAQYGLGTINGAEISVFGADIRQIMEELQSVDLDEAFFDD